MSSSLALYYPWMRFGDDNWLKLALLTWDNIARIRPQAAQGGDSELVRQLQAEADLIVDITPKAPIVARLPRRSMTCGCVSSSIRPTCAGRTCWCDRRR
jgi:hypothetical protein